MNTMRRYNTILLFFLSLFCACEKVIEIELPNPERKLVVEGEINSGLPAIVNLSYNMNYFDAIDSSTLSTMFINDTSAIVVVSDGLIYDTLQVLPITKFPFTAYVGTRLIGEKGKNYDLYISYKEKNYYARTSIPAVSPELSSIWFEPDRDNDSLGTISYSFFDDAATRDYYFCTSLTIGEQWWYYQPSVGLPLLDDQFFNGDSTKISLYRAYDGNQFFYPEIDSDTQRDSLLYYKRGNNISLRLSSIDQEFYLWWNSIFRANFTGSNPYSNPSTILTNIEGDPALGSWGGYANTFSNVHIPDTGNIITPIALEDVLSLILSDSIIAAIDSIISTSTNR